MQQLYPSSFVRRNSSTAKTNSIAHTSRLKTKPIPPATMFYLKLSTCFVPFLFTFLFFQETFLALLCLVFVVYLLKLVLVIQLRLEIVLLRRFEFAATFTPSLYSLIQFSPSACIFYAFPFFCCCLDNCIVRKLCLKSLAF